MLSEPKFFLFTHVLVILSTHGVVETILYSNIIQDFLNNRCCPPGIADNVIL